MKIAILGYGVEGESVYNYYRRLYPEAEFTVYDNKTETKNPLPEGVEFVGGVKDFKGIDADIAIKTPAIAPWNVEVTGEVTTMTRVFMKRCPAPVIGVTGTKGKGTTASMIKSILDASGKKAWLVGNIGVGAFDVLDQISAGDVVVYELSSFQLWDCDTSPQVAVILKIEAEHLDIHKDFDDYLRAKANIRIHQSPLDYCFYHPTNEYAEQIAHHPTLTEGNEWADDWRESNDWNWNAFKFNAKNDRDDSVWVARYEDDGFYVSKGADTDSFLCAHDALQVPGDHNKENATAAITAAMRYTDDFSAVEKGLRAFKGLPFHIELVREIDGVSYYNDSFSTAPAATEVALKSLDGPVILIAGGYDRGYNYEDMASIINGQSNVKDVLLIGETGPKIAEHLAEGTYVLCGDMESAVARASQLASAGDAVLFSPGFASFDMFRDFTERGHEFTRLVGRL